MTIATGSQKDFVRRIRAVLPLGWFPSPPAVNQAETAPILTGLLAGPANAFAAIWQLLAYLLAQGRISTSTGPFLDMVAVDYFGQGNLTRNLGELDDPYRTRILAALFPARTTRAAVSGAVKRLTGAAPLIIEPRRAADTKGYGGIAAPASGGGYGYGAPGLHYGSRLTPFQSFAQVDNSAVNLPDATIAKAVAINLPESYVVWLQVSD